MVILSITTLVSGILCITFGTQNNSLKTKNDELAQQNDLLNNSNNELLQQNSSLNNANKELAILKDQINQQLLNSNQSIEELQSILGIY